MAAVSTYSDMAILTEADSLSVAWVALGGGGSGLAVETDFWVQGGTSISKQVKTETKGMMHRHPLTIPGYVALDFGTPRYFWLYTTTPKAMDYSANGGMRITGGDDDDNRKEWYVSGSDVQELGGWNCYVITGNTQGDNTIGSPIDYYWSGGVLSNTGAVRGINFGLDYILQGDFLRVWGGDGADADANLDSFLSMSTSFGPFIYRKGNYELLTELIIGVNTSPATEFTQIGGSVIIPRRQLTTSMPMIPEELSKISIMGANTTATFSGTSFLGLDYLNRGLITTRRLWLDNYFIPSATFDGCSFEGIGRIELATGSTLTGCTVKNVNQVDLSHGGTIDNCKMQGSGVTGSLSNITNCSFSPSRHLVRNWVTLKVNGSSIDYTSELPITIEANGGTFGSDADGDYYETGTNGANPIRINFGFDPYGLITDPKLDSLSLRFKFRTVTTPSSNDIFVTRAPGYTGNDNFLEIYVDSNAALHVTHKCIYENSGTFNVRANASGFSEYTNTHVYLFHGRNGVGTSPGYNFAIDGTGASGGYTWQPLSPTPSNSDWVLEIGGQENLRVYEFQLLKNVDSVGGADTWVERYSTSSTNIFDIGKSYSTALPSYHAITTDAIPGFYTPSDYPNLSLDGVVYEDSVTTSSQTGATPVPVPFNWTAGGTPTSPSFTGVEPHAFSGLYSTDWESNIFNKPMAEGEAMLICWKGYLESAPDDTSIVFCSIQNSDESYIDGDAYSFYLAADPTNGIDGVRAYRGGSTSSYAVTPGVTPGTEVTVYVRLKAEADLELTSDIYLNNSRKGGSFNITQWQSGAGYKIRFGTSAVLGSGVARCRGFQIFKGATINDLPDPLTYQMPDGPPIGPAESLVGNTFTGYGADGEDDAAIFFTADSGQINVNVSGGSTPTYKSNGATVNFIVSSALTLTGLVDGSEVRVYAAGTTNEVAGEESVSGGTFNASISEASVDIVVFALGYLYLRLSGVDTSTDRTIPIQQRIDRQYENP